MSNLGWYSDSLTPGLECLFQLHLGHNLLNSENDYSRSVRQYCQVNISYSASGWFESWQPRLLWEIDVIMHFLTHCMHCMHARVAILFNKTCLNENILPIFTNINPHEPAARNELITIEYRKQLVKYQINIKKRRNYTTGDQSSNPIRRS